MTKNPFGKSRDISSPYAIYKGVGPFGETECRVLKTYQVKHNEDKNPYARWFVAVSSEHTFGSYDMGDSYIADAIYNLKLVDATPEWLELYGFSYQPTRSPF